MTIAKAYSGLSDAEIAEVDKWIRAHTLERFGPVRSSRAGAGVRARIRGHRVVTAAQIRCRGALSTRIARWRHDKPASEADTLDNLKALIAAPSAVRGSAHVRFSPSPEGASNNKMKRFLWQAFLPLKSERHRGSKMTVRVRIAHSPDGRPARGHGVHRFVQLRVREKARRQIYFAHRRHGPSALDEGKRSGDFSNHCVGWGSSWDEGPGCRRFRLVLIGSRSAPKLYQRCGGKRLGRSKAKRIRCFCTAERLDALRAQQKAEKRNFGYDRHCRNLPARTKSKRSSRLARRMSCV